MRGDLVNVLEKLVEMARVPDDVVTSTPAGPVAAVFRVDDCADRYVEVSDSATMPGFRVVVRDLALVEGWYGEGAGKVAVTVAKELARIAPTTREREKTS